MLFRLLTAPVKGPLDLVLWTGKKIHEAAETELNNPEKIKRDLVQLEERLERGELTEEEFEELELELVTRLRDISQQMRQADTQSDQQHSLLEDETSAQLALKK